MSRQIYLQFAQSFTISPKHFNNDKNKTKKRANLKFTPFEFEATTCACNFDWHKLGANKELNHGLYLHLGGHTSTAEGQKGLWPSYTIPSYRHSLSVSIFGFTQQSLFAQWEVLYIQKLMILEIEFKTFYSNDIVSV